MFKTKAKTQETANAESAQAATPPKQRAKRPKAQSAVGQSQRRTIRAGLLLVTGVIGVAGGFVMLHRSTASTAVYIATKAIPAGATIAASDLGVEQVPAPGISGALTLPAILHHQASVAILPGEVLTTGLATSARIRSDQAVIGISLTAGHMPSVGLVPGTLVEMVYTGQNPLVISAAADTAPAPSSTTPTSSPSTSLSASPGSIIGLGVVSSVIPAQNGGATLVDLIVSTAEVPISATAAANGAISLARRS